MKSLNTYLTEGFFQNIHASPLDSIRDFLTSNKCVICGGRPLERLKLKNQMTALLNDEYIKFGSFTFQFQDNYITYAVKIDGDNSRVKWGGHNKNTRWGKQYTIDAISNEIIYILIVHQYGDLVNFELI